MALYCSLVRSFVLQKESVLSEYTAFNLMAKRTIERKKAFRLHWIDFAEARGFKLEQMRPSGWPELAVCAPGDSTTFPQQPVHHPITGLQLAESDKFIRLVSLLH
jgi:hypothetical protein